MERTILDMNFDSTDETFLWNELFSFNEKSRYKTAIGISILYKTKDYFLVITISMLLYSDPFLTSYISIFLVFGSTIVYTSL